jgi:2-Cys peroxiredoxin 5
MLRPTLFRPLARAATAPLTRPVFTTPRIAAAAVNTFHTTAPRLIKPGDPLPDTDALMENTPGHRVNLADEAQRVNNMLLIGVPAAFSPACSATHVPGYMNHPRTKEFEMVGVVSVNDVFV